MNLLNKISNPFRNLSRKTAVVLIALASVTGVTGAAVKVAAEFYPNRPTFDYNKPCDANDADIYDRCGSLTGPVFNSFINTPSYGDERAFLDARRSDQTALGSYKDVLNDVNGGSQEVVLRTYVHNNANQSTNANGTGIARNAKVRIALPTATSQTLRARSYISADNAALVEDTVDLVGTDQFSVEYVTGSAVLYDGDNFANGTPLNDSIVGGGALIGSDTLNGNINGCFEYAATVEIRVKIKPKSNPATKLVKEIRKSGEKDWKKEVRAKPGDTVDWLITVDNEGATVLNNVIIRDLLPPHLQLVAGSVKRINSNDTSVQDDKPLFDGGINVGTYPVGSGFYVAFSTKVLDTFKACETRVRNIAYTRSDQIPTEVNDDADLIITKENCQPTVVVPPATTISTTPKPAELPKTGAAGSLLGIFSGVTVAGSVAHRMFTVRRARSL